MGYVDLKASTSSTSGPAISGGGGVTFGDVNLSGTTTSSSSWMSYLPWIIGFVLLILFWKPIKKLLHL